MRDNGMGNDKQELEMGTGTQKMKGREQRQHTMVQESMNDEPPPPTISWQYDISHVSNYKKLRLYHNL